MVGKLVEVGGNPDDQERRQVSQERHLAPATKGLGQPEAGCVALLGQM